MDSIPDEVLMAFADGALPRAEHDRIAARIASEPHLQSRLQPFEVTRVALPELFNDVLAGPIPEHIMKTVLHAPMSTATRKIANAPSQGFFARTLTAIGETLFPAGMSLPHAFALTALVATAGAAGWMATRSNTPAAGTADVAPADSAMIANGALAATLESVHSVAFGAKLENGQAVPVLTFLAKDGRFCRQYELVSAAGKSFAGFACRQSNGTWAVQLHTEVAKAHASPSAGPYQSADGGGVPAVEAAIDRAGDGGRLEPADEINAIANGWAKPAAR